MNDKKVKAIAYTIRGIEDANVCYHFFLFIILWMNEYSFSHQIWQKFQHVEYMQAGFLKMFQVFQTFLLLKYD